MPKKVTMFGQMVKRLISTTTDNKQLTSRSEIVNRKDAVFRHGNAVPHSH